MGGIALADNELIGGGGGGGDAAAAVHTRRLLFAERTYYLARPATLSRVTFRGQRLDSGPFALLARHRAGE